MPLYSAICHECAKFHSYVRTVANRADTPECCGAKTEKVLDTPMIGAMVFTGHKGFLMTSGKEPTWIESGADYQRHLDKHNLIPASEGTREAEIQRANKEEAHAKVRRQAVIDAVQAAS